MDPHKYLSVDKYCVTFYENRLKMLSIQCQTKRGKSCSSVGVNSLDSDHCHIKSDKIFERNKHASNGVFSLFVAIIEMIVND